MTRRTALLTATSRAQLGGHRRLIAVEWGAADTIPSLTAAAAITITAAALFAIVGVPRFDVMWLFHRAGVVGPSCGITRAAVALAGGHIGRAWAFNPAVFVLAPVSAALIVRAAYGRLTGRCLTIVVGRHRTIVWL